MTQSVHTFKGQNKYIFIVNTSVNAVAIRNVFNNSLTFVILIRKKAPCKDKKVIYLK